MLNNELKSHIQSAYSTFLEAKGLKPRYGQRLMIAEIAKVFGAITTDETGSRTSDPAIIAVEAGTGTGKTVAYSIASIPCAAFEEKKLIISTATVALQEQIIYKDLPDIAKHTDLKFSYALAKGRGRYLCLTKLDHLLQEDQYTSASLFEESLLQTTQQLDISLYKEMLHKLAGNKWDGDRDSWPKAITDEEWQLVTTEHSQCTNRLCGHFQNCSFFKARNQLDEVDIIVTNHDMVLADLALGGGAVLPAPQESFYIFDEGHHLADKAINHFAHFTRLQATSDWLDQTAKTLTKLLKQYAPSGDFGKILEKIPDHITPLREQHRFMLNALMAFFTIPEQPTDRQDPIHYRFDHGVIPENLQAIALELKQGFAQLLDLLTRLTDQLKQAIDNKITLSIPNYIAEDWYPAFGGLLARTENNWSLWTAFSLIDKENTAPYARWLTLLLSGNYLDIEIHASPILAADVLRQNLWNKAHGALLTSATLTALGKFDRLKMQAGLPDTTVTCVVPSPFQYEQAGLIRVPKMQSDPRDAQEHTEEIISLLPSLTKSEQGVLVLFSSRKQMLDVHAGLDKDFQTLILVQNNLSKQELLNQHKARIDKGKPSILFGLASLAEGVDLPGQYCEHVIIAKIPFAVPDDPIEAALAEWIEKRGGNPFMEITVPDASLRLIQACGRLIRTEQDKGTITLLDRRIVNNKSYGRALLNALPPFRRELF